MGEQTFIKVLSCQDNKVEDMFKKMGKVSVKPFIDSTNENMGLEDYGFAIFPGTSHEEQLAAIERNGVVRYVTGLDEFAPEVQRLSDPAKKEAVIRNIRMVVAELEKQLASNVIKVDDEEFWDKVSLLKPNNHYFKCANFLCFFSFIKNKNREQLLLKVVFPAILFSH